jgi:gamma-tubulin complex component 5
VTHYSPTAVNSILSDVQIRSTQTSLLRRYISQTLSPITTSTDLGPSKTAQAFAEACRGYIAKLDYWLASLELAFVRGVLPGERQICTPLSLRLGLDTRFGYILDCLSTVLPYATSASSGRSPDTILNALYSLLINTPTPTHRQELLEIFLVAATPLWDMLGDWLVRGMPIPRSLTDFDSQSEKERPLDPEFWIKRDQDVSWADEDFWEAAFLFAGNGEEERQSQPDWIDNTVLESVLEAGKARGLLRGLLGRDADYNEQLGLWRPLSSLLADMGYEGDIDLVDILSNYLKPICQLTTFQLRRTLDEECGLQAHLDAIDGLFYLKGYSVLQPWTEWLFSQVCPPT